MELIAISNAGIEAGINDDGDLFLGDDRSGYNLPLTRKNVDRVVSDFNRYLDKDETKLTADSFKEYIQDDEDEEVEESINIRESLLNIDKDTDNEYDLCTLYESLQLNDNEKRDVVKMLKSNTSPSDIYECLNNKLVNETWLYKGTENNNMKTVNEAKRRAHVFDDLVDEITTRLANKGMRSDTDKYLGIYDETTSSDDADGKFRMEIGELKFDYDKKTGDHVIIVQPEEGSPRDLSFARSIAREYAQEGVRVEEKKHNGRDAIFFYIPEDAEPFDHPAPEFKGRGEYLKKVTPWIKNKKYVELEKQYNDKLIDIFKEEGWEDPQRVVDGDKVSITFKDDDGYVYDYTTDYKSELIDLYKKRNKIDDFARYMYEVAFEQADMKESEEVMKESLNQYQLTDKVTEYVDDDDVIAYEKIARVLRTNLDNLYVVEDDSYDYDPQFLDRSGRRVAGIEAFKYEVNGIPVVRERAFGGLRMYFRNSDDAEKYVEYVKEENGLDESLDDDAVQAGETFIEDGREWQWIKQIGDVEHIDFDNWAVWFATDVDTQDGGYFIVDIDTGFIDWGPVDTEGEAKEFLQSKVDDEDELYEDDSERVSATIPNDLLNNPDKVDFKSYISRRSADAKAEKERQEKEARMAERAAQYKDVLDHARELMKTGNVDEAIEVLFEALVPQSGQADTVAGELTRAMMRILYRDYNDGDLFYEGYGIETCGSSVAYIIDVIGDHLIDTFEGIALRQLQDDSYTQALKEVTKAVVNAIISNNEYITTDNEENSRSRKWKQYYEDRFKNDWEPRYDYSFEVADKIYDHIHAGNITMQDVVSRMEDNLMYESGFDGVEVYSSGKNLIIDNLTTDALEQLEYWDKNTDQYWSDYIDELNDAYGDPDDDLSE